MADVHSENIEINAIIAGMNNIPVINAIESEEDDSEDDSSEDEENIIVKRTRIAEPERLAPRMTTSLSFTEGTSSSSSNPQDGDVDAEGSDALGVQRQSRAASASPGAFPRTQSPSDTCNNKNYYRDALLRESYNTRINFMKGSWLLEKAAARRALISRDVEGSPKIPHGTKRKNNNPSETSYDPGSPFRPSSPAPSTSPQA